MPSELLRQQDQGGASGGVFNREKRLQKVEAVPGDGIVLKRWVEHGHLPRGGCAASGSITAGGLQWHDIIACAATIEGPRSLDLATRHYT